MEEMDWISRDHPQYIDIENFEDHELTICIAYEMAIRSSEVIKIINKNLYDNTYWYGIDLICKINLILDEYKVENIETLSQVKDLVNHSNDNIDLKDRLYSLIYEDNLRIYYTTSFQENLKKRDYEYLNDIKAFYKLVSKFRKETESIYVETLQIGEDFNIEFEKGRISFLEAFKAFIDIGSASPINVMPESRREIELYFSDLEVGIQKAIKKMIELNVDLSHVSHDYNILYQIDDEDAKVLQDEYMFDVYNNENIASLKHLYIEYIFFGIFPSNLDIGKSYPTKKEEDPLDSIPAIDIKEEHFTIKRSRPLLLSAKVADNIILTPNEDENCAQIELLIKKVKDRQEFLSKVNIYNLFVDDPKDKSVLPLQNNTNENKKISKKTKFADMFFLYDNIKTNEGKKALIKQEYLDKIKSLKYSMKKLDETLDAQYGYGEQTYREKIKFFKSEEKREQDKQKYSIRDFITTELIMYHNLAKSGENTFSYLEYKRQLDAQEGPYQF